jgi:hypothetical protein
VLRAPVPVVDCFRASEFHGAIDMDGAVVDTLVAAGIDVSLREAPPAVAIQRDAKGRARPAGDDVMVMSPDGERMAEVRLKRAGELFTGSAVPPEFTRGPTREYLMFFTIIERTAMQYCAVTDYPETDEEFHRLYRRLNRKPDADDHNPLFSYIRAAARLYMSLKDTSRAELEAVAARIAKAAKTFRMGPTSRNYFEQTRGLL